ncbi:unnamed protein product [Malus baccata var. baccata]
MKVLFWNIRGIGNDDSRTELSNICRLHHPDLVCIAEPMVTFNSISTAYWDSLNLSALTFNSRGTLAPNLWLLTSSTCADPLVISISDQQVTVRCTFDHIPSQFTFVYASTSSIKRRDLWADFISLRPQTQVPWMAIGDFNAILGAHEQMGGGRPSQASCAEFSNMSDTCNFTHLNTSGAAFTWSNGWRSRGRTERRLDRSLCDISWFDSWPHSNCIALPKVVSDHNPLIFSGSRVLRNGHRPFRFQSMWVQHPSFRETVTHCWRNTVVYGCPMFIILQKLKALKTCLRQWNFSVFGDVHNRVANARHNLSMIQQRISIEGINNDLFEEEIVAKTTVMESLQMQEAFWKDRARVKWLTKGDINSSFFHAYARIKSSSSHISCILDGNNLLADPLAIESHIVNFYQTLFGSSFTPSGIDEVCEVIQPMVTDSENDLLSALPTDEEIKEAVFSLSASSAPGPDGFPGIFYHHCWDIVSFDVIQFVKQFFQSNWLYPNTNSNFLVLIPKFAFLMLFNALFLHIKLLSYLADVSQINCRWVIGNGSTTSLWVDKWLDKPIVDVVGATEIAPSLSHTKVSNIIRMGQWVIPSIFSSTFPDLTKEILEMPLPIDEDKDVLIWEASTSGGFSFSDGYEIVRHRFPVKSWASIIWRPFIPPRYSILRRGIPLAPICQLCHKNSESIDHLFSSCDFAQCAWRWLATQFGTIIPPTGSLSDL